MAPSLLVLLAAAAAVASAQDVRRASTEDASVFMTQSAIDSLEQKIMQKASENFAQQSVNSVATAVKSSIDTSFAFVQPLLNKTDAVEKQVDALSATVGGMQSEVTSAMNDQVSSFKDDINKQLDTFKSESDERITASLKKVTDTLTTVTDSIGKVRTNADNLACNSAAKGVLRLKGNKMEACDGSNWKGIGGGSKHHYVQWGNNVCASKDKGVKQLYSGYAWGGYHDHRAGGAPVCLKSGGGSNGGKVDGDDSANLLYALRLEGTGAGNGNIQNSRMIRCSMCVVERSCYLEMGLNGCATSDYEPMYSGSSYGGYHSHYSNNNRICIDRAGRYDNGNSYGAYMYPTKLKNNFDGRQSESFVKCHVCCEK